MACRTSQLETSGSAQSARIRPHPRTCNDPNTIASQPPGSTIAQPSRLSIRSRDGAVFDILCPLTSAATTPPADAPCSTLSPRAPVAAQSSTPFDSWWLSSLFYQPQLHQAHLQQSQGDGGSSSNSAGESGSTVFSRSSVRSSLASLASTTAPTLSLATTASLVHNSTPESSSPQQQQVEGAPLPGRTTDAGRQQTSGSPFATPTVVSMFLKDGDQPGSRFQKVLEQVRPNPIIMGPNSDTTTSDCGAQLGDTSRCGDSEARGEVSFVSQPSLGSNQFRQHNLLQSSRAVAVVDGADLRIKPTQCSAATGDRSPCGALYHGRDAGLNQTPSGGDHPRGGGRRKFPISECSHKCQWLGCSRRFRTSSEVYSHMRVHTGERPFKCDRCGKAFSQSGGLVRHVRTHTGDRPYVCVEPGCGRRFCEPSNLTRHRRVHAREATQTHSTST